MTLITYPTRVHFADGVLEEALRSELYAHEFSAPLILGEEEVADGNLSQRVYAGLPRRSLSRHISIGPTDNGYDTARSVEKVTRTQRPDVIVAFGSARAIAHARKCRNFLHQRDYDGATRVKPLDIFAVPGIDGLPNPCSSTPEPAQTLLDSASRTGLPRIMICDPTAMDGVTPEEAACAAADALSRSLEAYLSDAYNPLADGMALDGFRRSVRVMTTSANADEAAYRRELMAACLNAALSQQKGIGTTQIMSDALRLAYGKRISSGAISRILLPQVLKTRDLPLSRGRDLTQVLDIDDTGRLEQGVKMLFKKLPLAQNLSDLGITQENIDAASRSVREKLGSEEGSDGASASNIMEAVL